MLKGKEGFCLVAYEVVCNCHKFIQSVSVGHPGTRNNKQHIVRTDNTVRDGLVGKKWLAELQVLDNQCWCEWIP